MNYYINNVNLLRITMNSKNIESVIPVIMGISMLFLFGFAFNSVNAQPVTSENVTKGNGTVTATPNTTSPATTSTVNVTTDNSTFNNLNTLNQTANQTSPNIAVQE